MTFPPFAPVSFFLRAPLRVSKSVHTRQKSQPMEIQYKSLHYHVRPKQRKRQRIKRQRRQRQQRQRNKDKDNEDNMGNWVW